MGDPGPSGRFGQFGGRFVPESLVPACIELEAAFRAAWADPAFRAELDGLLGSYGGRPTPVTECGRLSAELGVRVLLKREDLAHTGSHKLNNVVGQGLLARRMGKTRLIAETGAGQHGVATATAAALFGMECVVYMGEVDTHRQELNVFRMELLGAEVRPVYERQPDPEGRGQRGAAGLGGLGGRHPLLRRLGDGPPSRSRGWSASSSGSSARRPASSAGCSWTAATPTWWWPAPAAAPTPPGSSPGSPTPPTPALVAVEAAGGAAMTTGIPGVLHGMRSALMQDEEGQILEAHSISAGLDYPGIGPEHAHLGELGPGPLRVGRRRPGARGLPAPGPDRGDHPRPRVGPRPRLGDRQRRHRRPARRVDRAGQPVRAGRQGRRPGARPPADAVVSDDVPADPATSAEAGPTAWATRWSPAATPGASCWCPT